MERIQPEGRVARRQKRNREAVLQAGHDVMSEKGIDAATMQEIAARADVGAGPSTATSSPRTNSPSPFWSLSCKGSR